MSEKLSTLDELRALYAALDEAEMDEVVRFQVQPPPGVSVDPKQARGHVAKIVKTARKAVRSGEPQKKDAPDYAYQLRQRLKAAGAHKAAAKIKSPANEPTHLPGTEPHATAEPEKAELRPHQHAANDAETASKSAHDMDVKMKSGEMLPDAAATVASAHRSAHDKNLKAAQAHMAAGQHSVAREYADRARHHATMVGHYHTMHQRAGHERGLAAMRAAAHKRAVGEAIETPNALLAEHRRLSGLEASPSLTEAGPTLQDLSDFEELIQSLPGQQRQLMGLGNPYPSLAEARQTQKEGILDFVKSHAPTPTNIKNYAQSGAAGLAKATSGDVGGALGALKKQHLGGEDESKSLKVVMARRKKKAEASETAANLNDSAANPDVPASVKHQARSIEKKAGPFKKRAGGAKTRAGIAHAIAWKHYCKENPGSRHCHQQEASPPPLPAKAAGSSALAKLGKKFATSDAAHDTLAKLRAKHGMEAKEEGAPPPLPAKAAGNSVLAKLSKKYAASDAAHDTLAKLRAKHGMEAKEAD